MAKTNTTAAAEEAVTEEKAPDPTVNEEPKAEENEKTVKIRLPKDRDHKEDVWVRVNERKWLIQRGVEVEVPECVYEVLRHQEEMHEIILAFEEKNAKDA